jgi:hypothetical protein
MRILLHALVALVVVERDRRAVAVDAQRELREIVRADREAVEARGEAVDEDHVVGDLAHGVDLEAVFAAPGRAASSASGSSRCSSRPGMRWRR